MLQAQQTARQLGLGQFVKLLRTMSKYTERLSNLLIAARCCLAEDGWIISIEELESQFEDLDADPPSLSTVAESLRCGDEKGAQIDLLWLIVNGKDVSGTVQVDGVSYPLIVYAASINAEDIVRLLIGQKVDVNAVDSEGFSALYLATSPYVVKELQKAGAKEICKEDLVKVNQNKELTVKMNRFERMSLCDMAVCAMEPGTDYDSGRFMISSWYLLDYMLEKTGTFSFMVFVYALANSVLEFADDFADFELDDHLRSMEEKYLRIDIPKDSFKQFRKLFYNDPKLFYNFGIEDIMYHPLDESSCPVKDLKPTCNAYLFVLKEAFDPVDTDALQRERWGLISQGYGGGKF